MSERIPWGSELVEEEAGDITRLCFEDDRWSFGAPNFYIARGNGGIALIDSGQGIEPEIELFNKTWTQMGQPTVDVVILTHHHFDHSGGAKEIHNLTGATVIGGGERRAADDMVDVHGRKLRIIPTPGHTTDSLCVMDESTGTLFTGDTIIEGMDSVVVTNMIDYVESLKKIEGLAPSRILSGHGVPVGEPMQIIEKYIANTQKREDHIVTFIGRGCDTAELLFAKMYPHRPRSGMTQIISHIE